MHLLAELRKMSDDWEDDTPQPKIITRRVEYESSDQKPRTVREPRAGDWACPECSANNFSNKTECFKCQAAKPEGLNSSDDRPVRAPREPRAGDWVCPDCSANNFSNKTECFKCQAEKPEGLGGGERTPREKRPGEWECPECKISNFASRTECFKCSTEKPEGAGVVEGEKPREHYIPPEPTQDEDVMFGTGIHAGINFDNFEKIEVKLSGNGCDKIKKISSFQDSKLREFLLTNVTRSGYTKPTPIQKLSIPIIQAKRDLMGCAQTGSGKTAAFILPILDRIMEDSSNLELGRPQCLVIAPTRELVIQIFEEARKFAHSSYLKVCLAYGGTATRHQSEAVTRGCHVLVATPGRLMDFVDKGMVTFEDLKFLVLDEADRMLDMGFRSSIEKICKHETMNKTPKPQTLMFSATFPDEIQRLAGEFLHDYMFLTIGIVGGASADVEQSFLEVTKFKKRNVLIELLQSYAVDTSSGGILVFVETKRTADFLASILSETDISSTSIHGDRLQRERELALREFRDATRKVLVATSVAARGLDIKGVTHVINYDMPKDIQEYVHRIGRTGRVGNKGKATTFYDPENDSAIAGEIVRILTQAEQPIPDFLGSTSSSFGDAEQFGARDIRKGVDAGHAQEPEEDW
ncbi:unnamed protein product [Diamesa hyperborea]